MTKTKMCEERKKKGKKGNQNTHKSIERFFIDSRRLDFLPHDATPDPRGLVARPPLLRTQHDFPAAPRLGIEERVVRRERNVDGGNATGAVGLAKGVFERLRFQHGFSREQVVVEEQRRTENGVREGVA